MTLRQHQLEEEMSSDHPMLDALDSSHHSLAGMDPGVAQFHGSPLTSSKRADKCFGEMGTSNLSTGGGGSVLLPTRPLPPASELLSSTSSSSPFNFSSSTSGRYFGNSAGGYHHSPAGYYDGVGVGAQPPFSNLVQQAYPPFGVGVNSNQQSPRSLPPPSPYTAAGGPTFRQALTEPATPAIAPVFPTINHPQLMTDCGGGTSHSLDELAMAGMSNSASGFLHHHHQQPQLHDFDVSIPQQQLQQFRIPTPINPYASIPVTGSSAYSDSAASNSPMTIGVPPVACYQSPSAEQQGKLSQSKRSRVNLTPTTTIATATRIYSTTSPLTILPSTIINDEGPTVKEHLQKQQAELKRREQQQLMLKHRQKQQQGAAQDVSAVVHAGVQPPPLSSPQSTQSLNSGGSHLRSSRSTPMARPAASHEGIVSAMSPSDHGSLTQLGPVPAAPIKKQRRSRHAVRPAKSKSDATSIQYEPAAATKFPDSYSMLDHQTSNEGRRVGGCEEEEENEDTLSSIIASVASGATGSLRSPNKSLGSRPSSPHQQPCFFEPTSPLVKMSRLSQHCSTSPQKFTPAGRRKQAGSSSFSSPSKSFPLAACTSSRDASIESSSSYPSPQFTRIHVQNTPSDCDFLHPTGTTIHVVRSGANEPTVRDLVKSPLLFHPVTIIGGRVKPPDQIAPIGRSAQVAFPQPEGTYRDPQQQQPQLPSTKKGNGTTITTNRVPHILHFHSSARCYGTIQKNKVKGAEVRLSGDIPCTSTGPLSYNTHQQCAQPPQRLHVIQPYSVVVNDSKSIMPKQARIIPSATQGGADTSSKQRQANLKPPTTVNLEERDEFRGSATQFRKYSVKYYHLHRTLKALVYKNAALCDELARLRQRIYTVTEERRALAKRLQHHERNRARRVQAQKRKAEYRAKRKVEKFLQQGGTSGTPGENESTVADDQSASILGSLNDSFGDDDADMIDLSIPTS